MGQLCFTCSNISHSVPGKKGNYLFMSTKETDNTELFLRLLYIFQSINVFYHNMAGRKNLILVLYFTFHLCL